MANLSIAFPNKTEDEKRHIAKGFYQNLIDTFIETIKLLSASDTAIARRVECHSQDVLNNLHPEVKYVQLVSGHFFNWEFANYCIARFTKYKLLAVYMPIANRSIERLIFKLRCRYGTVLLPATRFKSAYIEYADVPHAIGLVGDQNPGDENKAYWMNFFSRPAPFVRGPEKNAKLSNAAVVYGDFYKTKRGYYRIDLKLITTQPNEFKDGYLTRTIIDCVEAAIQKRPSNYLWSHRRWKHRYQPDKHEPLIANT
jgi:KDO2-lipid IV(A) lauroyltransferase